MTEQFIKTTFVTVARVPCYKKALRKCSYNNSLSGNMRYFHIVFIAQFSLVFSLQLEESVLENGRSGADVVLLSIAYVHQAAIFQDDNSLLRRIAFVETRDGSNLDAFNQGNNGGIWAIDKYTLLNTQVNETVLVRKHEEIKHLFGIEWEAVQWSELKKPFYSALAARLVLFLAPEDIPSSEAVPAQAQFWRDNYNHADGSVNDFMRAVNKLEGKYISYVRHSLVNMCRWARVGSFSSTGLE